MKNLWTCAVDLKTGTIRRSVERDDGSYPNYESYEAAYADGWLGGAAGYATLEDDEVYAESVVSQEDADRLVREKCVEMLEVFRKALSKFD